MAEPKIGPRQFPQSMDESFEKELSKASDALTNIVKKNHYADFLGWFDWPRHGGFELVKQVTADLSSLPFFFDTVVVVGIGGSYTGISAVSQALGHTYAGSFHGETTKPQMLYTGYCLDEETYRDLIALFHRRDFPVRLLLTAPHARAAGESFLQPRELRRVPSSTPLVLSFRGNSGSQDHSLPRDAERGSPP